MSAFQQFEDIEAWQDARNLVRKIYEATRDEPFSRDFGLCDQIQRSGVSIMANIAEGFERKNPNELAHYLRIARGSCAEVQSHLYVALDAKLIDNETFNALQQQATRTGSKISGFQRYLKSRNGQN